MKQCFFFLQNRISSFSKRATKSHQCRNGEGGGYPLSGTRLVLFVFYSVKEQENTKMVKYILSSLCRHTTARHSVV